MLESETQLDIMVRVSERYGFVACLSKKGAYQLFDTLTLCTTTIMLHEMLWSIVRESSPDFIALPKVSALKPAKKLLLGISRPEDDECLLYETNDIQSFIALVNKLMDRINQSGYESLLHRLPGVICGEYAQKTAPCEN